MQTSDDRYKIEKRILIVLLILSCFFVGIELIAALFTKSQALLIDAVFDTTELIMTAISIKLLPVIHRPNSEKNPYGYLQVETLLIIIKGFMMLIVTLGIFTTSIQIIFEGGSHIQMDAVAAFNLICTVLSLLVVIFLNRSNQKINSPLVEVEVKGWLLDAIISLGLGLAFLIPIFIHHPFIVEISPYIDPILSIVLGITMLPVPIKTIWIGFKDMFLFAPEEEIMDFIKSTTECILEKYDMKIVVYDVVRTGRKIWISLYFNPDQPDISIAYIARVQQELRSAMEDEISDLFLELVPNIE